MNAANFMAVALLALDGGAGSGVPVEVDRFAAALVTIPAIFAGERSEVSQIWATVYVDGDGLLAPVARGSFQPAEDDFGSEGLVSGVFSLEIGKTGGLSRCVVVLKLGKPAVTCGTFRLNLVPEDCLAKRWENVAAERGRQLTVTGKLTGLRELLAEHRVGFVDGDSGKFRATNLRVIELPPQFLTSALGPALDGSIVYVPDTRRAAPADFRESPSAQEDVLSLLESKPTN